MNRFKQKLISFRDWWKRQSTRKKIALIAVLAIVLFIVLDKGNTTTGSTVETVKRQNLVRSVSASGTVVSSTDLSLGFEQSKMVSNVQVVVGAKVKKGDVLATLSNGTERAAVSSAKGALLAARARYSKVLEGSSNEEIKLAQVQLDNARRAFLSDGLVAKPELASTTLTPTISGTYTGSEGQYRIEMNVLAQNKLDITGLERGRIEASDVTPQRLGTKGLFIQFPSGSQSSFTQGTVWTINIPNVESPAYVANKALVDEKQASLDIARATARQPDIDVALADVVTAQAGVDSAVAALEKTMLRAPADGTVTSVDVKVGEIAEIGKQAIAIQDVSNLYLEANINESNIKSVAVGQTVQVTFDAFSGDTFTAAVSSIDPAATIENNVVNYKIKALLTGSDTVRPGMTANMTILTAEVDNVLVLPARVITTTGATTTVNIIVDDRKEKTVPREVVLGLKGDGDMVEIKSGLNEGDRVVWTSK
jgi:RND family efflux transporter MFP subunit